jgi:hypothetical protein
MLTIITPSCRPKFLPKLKESIQFHKIDKWIIVYDTSRNRSYTKLFDHPKIEEVFCNVVGEAGHPQRNFGVNMVTDGHVYFLDDDNIIHHEFWNLQFNPDYFYTFDQHRDRSGKILKGNHIAIGKIDTAMFVVPRKMFQGISWDITRYDADGVFICQIKATYPNKHVYIEKVACYYNALI